MLVPGTYNTDVVLNGVVDAESLIVVAVVVL
jgi:hypothetical protein